MKNKLKGRGAEIIVQWNNGTPVGQLCATYGVVPSSMRAFLLRHGVISTKRKLVSLLRTITDVEAAYLAGIVDGEGCISARWVVSRGNKSVQSRVTVETCSEALSLYLVAVTGVGTTGMHYPQNPNWKPTYRWGLTSVAGSFFLQRIRPWLRIKHVQAELFIELAELKGQSTTTARFSPERQAEIVLQLAELNRRGLA